MKKTLPYLLLLTLCVLPIRLQAEAKTEDELFALADAYIEKALQASSREALDALIADFEKQGLNKDSLIYLSLTYYIIKDQQGAKSLLEADQIDGWIKAAESLLKEQSWEELQVSQLAQSGQGDFLMTLYYPRIRMAIDRKDTETVEALCSEAFLKATEHHELLAMLLLNYRDEQALKDLRLSLELEILNAKGEKTTLAEVLGEKEYLLVDFWASWCGPCIHLMPELKTRAAKYADSPIVVAGMNTEGDPAIASKVQSEQQMGPMSWLVEKEDVYSSQLRIDSIPRMVLINKDGEVLFNGHPMDQQLDTLLAEIVPQ